MPRMLPAIIFGSTLFYTQAFANTGGPPGGDKPHELILLTSSPNSSNSPVTTLMVGSFIDIDACREAAVGAKVIGDKANVTFICIQTGREAEHR